MIYRFKQIMPGVYRGSAPASKDIQKLIADYNIKKIISLDAKSGERIKKACKKHKINHIIFPMNGDNRDILKIIQNNIKEIFVKNGPIFIHCYAGKDRTGFISALLECLYLKKSCTEAINDAKKMGFGLFLNKKYASMVKKYEKVICLACKHDHEHYCDKKDNNSADIVSNVREYKGDNKDSYLDQGQVGSFSPMLSVTRQYPADLVYNPLDEKFPEVSKGNNINEDRVPRVGTYDNAAGIVGSGPVEHYGGFLHD
ncbi:MAG: tyrosine-protein phosphatase [Chitinophagales bacterium]|nr:tyrosine-protein phosphatase [Chitinophagales bacterium]